MAKIISSKAAYKIFEENLKRSTDRFCKKCVVIIKKKSKKNPKRIASKIWKESIYMYNNSQTTFCRHFNEMTERILKGICEVVFGRIHINTYKYM